MRSILLQFSNDSDNLHINDQADIRVGLIISSKSNPHSSTNKVIIDSIFDEKEMQASYQIVAIALSILYKGTVSIY